MTKTEEIFYLLKEHGDLTFEEMWDIGTFRDCIDLEVRLQDLAKEKKLNVYKNESDIRVFSLQC